MVNTRYNEYFRRENGIYYRRRKRARGSHSKWGERNPSGLSLHLKNTELIMSADERKNFRLPCGRTIGESWAALRKCWLAFYITRSQEDRQGMVEYAYRIRRIQAEMNIPPTNFDSDILDEKKVNRIDFLYRKSPSTPFNGAVDNDEESGADSSDSDIDYAQIMNTPDSSTESIPAPRQEIFMRTEYSCQSPAVRPNAHVDVELTDYEHSCYKGPPKPAHRGQIHIKKIKTIYEKQCQVPPTNQDNFAVSAPGNTLAVPNSTPNQPPIEPILRDNFCAYQRAKDPPQTIHKDKSCEYEPQVNKMKNSNKDKGV